jgi:hypothetical protein
VVAYVVVVVVSCGLAVGAVVLLEAGRDRGSAPAARAPVATEVEVVPGPGQAFLTGEVDSVTLDPAQGPPLTAPFTLTAVNRGVGGATISDALVGGSRTTITWGGGTPLPIDGTGGIDLASARLRVDGDGATWSVDGTGRSLLPGRYRAGAPVAVGAQGLADARDGVAFEADSQTVLTSHGDVEVHLRPRPVEVDGPGRLTATGRLQVRAQAGPHPAGRLDMTAAPYHVKVTPSAGGLSIEALLQGPFETAA